MKRMFVFLVSICLLTVLLAVPAFAYDTTGDHGDNITWVYDEATKTLTISGEGDIPEWQEAPWEKTFGPEIKHVIIEPGITAIGHYAFYECSAMETVSIPEGVTRIGGLAFNRCESLKEVILPESLTSAGNQVFNQCDSLTEVTIPAALTDVTNPQNLFSSCKNLKAIHVHPDNPAFESVDGVMFNDDPVMGPTYIIRMPQGFVGEYVVPEYIRGMTSSALADCRGLTKLTLSPHFTYFKDYAVAGCTALTEIVMPNSVNDIRGNAFYRCTALERVVISRNVSDLNSETFAGCTALKEIELPMRLETIGKKCFEGCAALTTVNIPANVRKISDDAFNGCTALAAINVEDGNSNFSDNDGVLFNHDQTTLIKFPAAKRGTYVVPATVTEIGTAFKATVGLTGVILPVGLKTIPEQAFQGCSALEYIEIPAGVTLIEDGAFRDCSAMEEIYIADTVIKIGRNAFENCTALKSVYIPDSVTEMGDTCFWNCTALEQIRISASMRVIPNTLVRGCTALKEVVIPYGAKRMESAVFYECSALERIYLPDTLLFIDCKQTIGCSSLTDLDFTGSESELQMLFTEPENEILYNAARHCNAEYPAPIPAPVPRPVTVVTPTPTPTPPAPVDNPFTDVANDAWYAAPVLWAKENNVTGGTSATTFGPEDSCTRAQVVTFLWAANGKPEPKSMINPFTDVAENAWYLKPVLWAVEQGITTGVSATEFGPENTCTRAQIATFLYAAAGKPDVSGKSTFADVKDVDWFAKPVIWAKENNVTGGISPTEFGPNQVCTRAQVVTFLYKVYG